MLNLLAAALTRGLINNPLAAPSPKYVTRRRIIDFIDANLFDRGLGPALLMRQFQLSRAHLYRLFAADGGVAKIVRDQRLDAAYRALSRKDASPPSMTAIAHNLGFSSSSQFSRAFRARFTMSPQEARRKTKSMAARQARKPAPEGMSKA